MALTEETNVLSQASGLELRHRKSTFTYAKANASPTYENVLGDSPTTSEDSSPLGSPTLDRGNSPSKMLPLPDWMAPLDTPMYRRKQMAAIVFFVALQVACTALSIFLIFTPVAWPFYLPYLYWIYFVDYKTPKNGVGRRRTFARRFPIMRWFCEYFPITLNKTADLDPNKNYLFGYHPHGIIAVGAVGAFGSEYCGVERLFPGLTISPATLSVNFKIPFYREVLISLGFIDVGRTSINNTLASKKKGNSAVIIVGGAAESLDAHPGTSNLTLKRRKGFVRLAIKHGASLVPVFAFGENNLWNQIPNPDGSWLRRLQRDMMKKFGWTAPMIFGRGVFNYKFGILPMRRPIHVVVGSPIDCVQNANPSQEEIDRVHSQYLAGLERLFKENCDRFYPNRKGDIQFVA